MFGGTVVVLLILAGVGYTLHFTNVPSGAGMTSVTTDTMNHTMTVTETMNQTVTQTVTESATPFSPASGQMVHSAWVLSEPVGGG